MKHTAAILILLIFCTAATSQTANFTYQSTTGFYCTPSSIKFTQITTGNPTGFVWSFGNNNGSNLANPTNIYTTSGTFTVRLIVIYKKKTITVTKNIVVNPAVVAHFEMDRNNLCSPGNIQFRANPYQNISSYEWDFGDNTAIVSTTSPNIGHHYADYGNYPISLKITVQSGCSGKSFTAVIVKKPVLTATVTPESGCTPAAVRFNATVGLPPAASVTSYLWKYGDGSPNTTTTVANSTHTYLVAGNYTPTVHITTNEGCSNDFILNNIAFGIPPTNHIAYPKLSEFCGSESPEFVSKAVNANKYFWDFGEGDTTSVTDTVMRHKFKTLGNKTVTVTPLFNNCPGTPISFTINVIGVIASFNYSNTCSNTKTFSLNNNSQGNLSTIAWNFGDESPALQSLHVVHSFPDTGTFKTKLSITDSITRCIDSYSRNIYTAEPILFNPDSSICKNSNTTFSIPYNYNNPAALYNWHALGLQTGPDNMVPLTMNAPIHGIFNNNFVIINNGPQYCPDTINLPNSIIVRGPILDFNAASEICLSKTFITNNTSRPYLPTDAIIDWKWNYGMPDWNDSIYQPLPYFYPYWGTFKVTLSATDINGCLDTLEKNVIIRDVPFLRSIPDVDTLCAGQSTTLIAFHNDPISWSPVNSITCSTCDTIIANPSVTTTYYVKATSRFNCSTTDSILIHVYNPFIATTKKINNYICANESVQLEVKPLKKKINWSPKTGLSDSTIFNPVASPVHSTTYIATLTDSVGCFSSSIAINVIVKTLPVVDAGPDKTYPYNTNYSFAPAYSNNVNSYNWTASTLLSCSNCAIPEGIATNTQTYTIKVTSDSGCVASDQVSIFVECNGASLLLPSAFTPNRDNLNDYYYPITRGVKKITRFSIYDRQGQLVFEAKDFIPNNKIAGWNGSFKGVLQNSAAYVYFIESVCDIGQQLNKKGSFLLIR